MEWQGQFLTEMKAYLISESVVTLLRKFYLQNKKLRSNKVLGLLYLFKKFS